MKAAVVNTPGEMPKYQGFDEPTVQEGEVLVRVRAAGVHPVVKSIASGAHYSASGSGPMIPGIDGVGTLEDGTRVYFGGARKPWGTMAERAAVTRSMYIPLPDEIDDVTAAAIANPGMSGWVALKDRAGLLPGETVLILGATGVAGQLAIQVARQMGAKRIVGAGRNIDALRDAGLDEIIALNQPEDDLRKAFIAEAVAGIDVVIDYLWGRPTELLLEALAKGFKATATHRTRLVEVGASAGPNITLPAAILRSIDLTILGSGFGAVSIDRIFAAIPELFALAASGALKIDVDPIPLSDVEAAWSRADKGRRIVLTV
ncbi:quinone oxidoreductase family protein [Terracidiphilus gabretensis]|uniref:quinone oxidoreductase family protein n=1 Tax=Terracidiphilus gabretensis TaxID=1577687 RepID=UPI00071BD60E|nr:zinc-binding alcohol dehydrogenase family protein [Terracidiphilus gabretensis]